MAYDPSALGAGASVVRAAKLLPGLFLLECIHVFPILFVKNWLVLHFTLLN